MESKRDWSDYIGRTKESEILISSDRVRGLAALLDYAEPPWANNHVPPTGHWLSMFPYTKQSNLGEDGHEKLGKFIPDTGYPRRMWVGGKIQYHCPIPVGQSLRHRTTITDIVDKTGKSGPMTFVTLTHEYQVDGKLMLREEQNIVYREASTDPIKRPSGKLSSADKKTKEFDWSRQIIPDSTLLFRYSAVTFNAHRIHFDHEYVKREGYPGLLVHAPLTTTFMIDLYQAANPDTQIKSIEYTAKNPMFDGDPIMLYGKDKKDGSVLLWAEDCSGTQTVTGTLKVEC